MRHNVTGTGCLLKRISEILLILLALSSFAAGATGTQPLDDTELSDVSGRDGLSFAVNLNANMSSANWGTSDSNGNPATLGFNNIVATGSVGGTLDIVSGASGTPDYVNWAFPNLGSLNKLQIGTDLMVTANGSSFGTGIQLKDVAFGGTSMQLTGAPDGGIGFGLGLNLTVGDVVLQPNGRGITTGQMDVNGIVIGAAGSNGSAPWILADVNAQPGVFTVLSDTSGNSSLQLTIGWPTAPGTAPAGSLQIGNVTFTTPGGNVNLGSSSIGSMQIQYLNVKFKT